MLILERLPGVFFREEIKVRFAERLARVGKAEPLQMCPAIAQEPALGVFEINAVREIIHEGSQQELLVPEPLVGFADRGGHLLGHRQGAGARGTQG